MNIHTKHLLFLTCRPRTVLALADEVTDHLEAQSLVARVLLYGISLKGQEGFIVLEFSAPMPTHLLDHLKADEDILTIVTCLYTPDEEVSQ